MSAVIATYRTAGGRELNVVEERIVDDQNVSKARYDWQCPGCTTTAPGLDRGYKHKSLDSAQSHAASCAAL